MAQSIGQIMDNDTDILKTIDKQFNLEQIKPGEYSPLSLAFIGDSIFDVIVKTLIVKRGNCQANKLHLRTSCIVKAKSQAIIIGHLMETEILTDEELNMYRRGHNAKSHTKAKNATYSDYAKATGLECLIGYLYLIGRIERAVELAAIGIRYLEDMSGN